ncbi:glycosyltransferase [uncultured Prochlorococcus sp.]|uniref:glycosyltransferase n=1 Tax=uncultured Prochlorococcus sp. TaxID=159733 RepID=UPI002589AD63|nr:glycosyltransferase [uncultured Prochlorococcus sp.]
MELSNKRIKWLISDLDMSIASVRLRCFHFARVLEEDFNIRSFFYNDLIKLERSLISGDILVIIKSLDFSINKIVLKSYSIGIPVILDICDNLIDSCYKQNAYSYLKNNLLSLIKFISLIIVPNNTLKEIILKNVENNENKINIFTIPDPAESEDDVFLTCEYLIKKESKLIKNFPNYNRQKISYKPITKERRTSKILWFGNSFSDTSNMGFVSMIPHLKMLKKMQGAMKPKFMLTICSNLKADISFLDLYDIKYELVDWTLENIFYQLSTSSCSLITTGNDQRCFTKSNNRILKSLINGCPPMVFNCYNHADLKDYYTSGLKKGIQDYLESKNREINIKNSIEKSNIILERYRIKNLAKTYNNIIFHAHLIKKIYGNNKPLLENEDSNFTVICDKIPIGKLVEILQKFRNTSENYNLKFFFYESSKELLEFFVEYKVIPYNCGTFKDNNQREKFLGRMLNVLKEDKYVIISNEEENNKILKLFAQYNFKIKYKSYIDFLSDYNPKKIIVNSTNNYFLPENIPGQNLPVNFLNHSDINLDVLFITTIQTKNWILDGIAKEIGSRSVKLNWSIFYYDKNNFKDLPKAKFIFFMHQSILDHFLEKKLIKFDQYKIMCWYTHPNPAHEAPHIISRYIENFNNINKVIFACDRYKKLWINRGLNQSKAISITGGADEKIFSFHDRSKSEYIGLCSSYYERKNPMLFYEIVKKMEDYKFILLGKNWENFALFDDLLLNGNVDYIQAKYNEYPKFYNKMNVFLSLANLEGGPIPLIEAMMSNCFPVASDVGLCSDVIDHGKNGFLFDPFNYKVEEVVSLIKKAFDMKYVNIRETVMEYNWNSFSKNVISQFE